MLFFKKPEPPAPEPQKPTPEPEPVATRAQKLVEAFHKHLPGIPPQAIIAQWAQAEKPGLYPVSCPSAIAEAFFLHPHDEAVDWFEKYHFPIDLFEKDVDASVVDFVTGCRARDLPRLVQAAVEKQGVEQTLKEIAAGFDETTATHILKLTL